MTKIANETAFFQKRLKSLDVFRGSTIALMILVNDPGSWSHVYPPLRHAKWHGWTFTDLVFPFFLFIVGVSISYALSRQKEQNPEWASIYKKIFRRTLILFGLGLFLSGFPFFNLGTLRIPGVLQRIALCYFSASVIFLHFKIRVPQPLIIPVSNKNALLILIINLLTCKKFSNLPFSVRFIYTIFIIRISPIHRSPPGHGMINVT